MILQPRMRSYIGFVIFFLLYSTESGETVYSLLLEQLKNLRMTSVLPLVRKLQFNICQEIGTCYSSRGSAWLFLWHETLNTFQTYCLLGLWEVGHWCDANPVVYASGGPDFWSLYTLPATTAVTCPLSFKEDLLIESLLLLVVCKASEWAVSDVNGMLMLLVVLIGPGFE